LPDRIFGGKNTMSKRGSTTNDALATARKPLDTPIDFEAWLAALGARDRVNLERHVAALEAEPVHATLWKRIARSIATLAPHAASTTGQQAVQFFIADGKYRMQVFALEDNRDGKIMIYSVDALADAMKADLIGKPAKDNPSSLPILAAPGQMLTVETLSAVDTPNPSPFYKHMLGWNRKALRITLPVGSSDAQVSAAESVCAIAASKWEKKPAGTAEASKVKVPTAK
jgi:hypothetical protein